MPWRLGLGGAAGNTCGAGWECLGGVSVGLPVSGWRGNAALSRPHHNASCFLLYCPVLPACRRWGEMPRLGKKPSSDSLPPSLQGRQLTAAAALRSTRRLPAAGCMFWLPCQPPACCTAVLRHSSPALPVSACLCRLCQALPSCCSWHQASPCCACCCASLLQRAWCPSPCRRRPPPRSSWMACTRWVGGWVGGGWPTGSGSVAY